MTGLLRQWTRSGDQSWVQSQLHYLLTGARKMPVNRRGPAARKQTLCFLPPWRMSGERRDQGLGDQPESSGPDNGAKRLEERVSGRRTNGVVMEEERKMPRFRPWAGREGELI